MKHLLTLFSLLFFLKFSAAQPAANRIDTILHLIGSQNCGLVVNHSSLLENGTHLVDTLLARGAKIKKIFAPEHGFRGNASAGEVVNSSVDKKTQLPIVSLYGKSKKPSPEMLQGLDVLVFDIQDVGARFYTYISTLHYVMEACAENGKRVIVLDRPNPCDFVDGPMRQDGFVSFVSLDKLPLLHGLTVAEFAQMLNGENWLSGKKQCQLQVIKCQNWKHGDYYNPPVPPSPNLNSYQAIRLYPSLCLFESTNLSIARGTLFPFTAIGYPDKACGDFEFTPKPIENMEKNPLHNAKKCYGLDLSKAQDPCGFTLKYIIEFYKKLGNEPAKFFLRIRTFDLLAGSDQIRKALIAGKSEEQIRAEWQPELEKYKQMRKKYLLYPDARY